MLLVVLCTIAMLKGGIPTVTSDHPRTFAACDGDKQVPDGCVCPDDSEEYAIFLPGSGGNTSEVVYVVLDEIASNGYLLAGGLFRESNSRDGLQRHDDYYTDDLAYTDADRDEILF